MFDEAALVEGVDSHLLDSAFSGDLVASRALHVGMWDIIEPCEVMRRRGEATVYYLWTWLRWYKARPLSKHA